VLELVERISKEEIRVDEVVDGFIDPNADTAEAALPFAEPEVEEDALLEDEEEEAEDDEASAEAANLANLEELKQQTLEHFAGVRMMFDKMVKVLEKKVPSPRAIWNCKTPSPPNSCWCASPPSDRIAV
jgi:RNA polymerase primary sigma factor